MVVSRLPKLIARAAALAAFAGLLSGCSMLPDWMGGDSDSTDTQLMDQQAVVAQDNGKTPDLADIPDKPAAPSDADQQKQVADTLQADRAHNQYSADALRGGTEAAAAPPGAPPPPSGDAVASTAPPATQAPAPQQQTASTEAPADNGADNAIDATGASGAASQPANPAAVASAAAPSSGAPAVPAAAPTTQVAMAEAPAVTPMAGSGMPAVPAMTPGPVPGAHPQVSDAELGFKPSTAPPLDASVAQFVPPSIIARYRQTAAVAPAGAAVPGYSGGPAVPASGKAMGGPEQMSGAVVANFDALQGGTVAPAGIYASNGVPPVAVVLFPHDTTILTASARAQVRAAVQAFQAAGGQGFIRVVGHSSSRTGNMSLARHLVYNFERSQARADAVARELIAEGVPAAKVLVEAVGDSQPVYYESMPEGEEGNRRAEIFLQS
ncbi:MAG TPA: OmpA family protein [Rhizomicrobium sp.]|nr:OmpA family protein [Rhizomicrobium sp.]